VIYVNPALPPAARDLVLLHEMVHQWQREVVRDLSWPHGPDFCDRVNEIGRSRRMPPVETSLDYLHWPLHTPLVAEYAHAGGHRREAA
jgi:hypothetical protein